MRHKLNSCPTWMLGVLLTASCMFGTIYTEDVTVSNLDFTSSNSPILPEITNSSEYNFLDIFNSLNIQKQIQELQHDGRLESLVYSLIAGVSADLPIQGECVKDIFTMLRGVTNFDMWAIQMLDAIGKPHSGILSDLDLKWLGSFDGCLDVKAITYSNSTGTSIAEHHFDGKYCKIQLPIPQAVLGLNPAIQYLGGKIDIGICLPDSCKTADLKSIMTLAGQSEPSGECHDGIELETKTIVAIVVLSILGLVVVIGTLYDIYMRLTEKTETVEHKQSIQKPPSQTNGATNGDIKVDLSAVSDEKPNGDLHADKKTNCEVILQETKPPAAPSTKPSDKRNTLEKIFLSFSVYSNGLKILNTNQPKGALTCINGIRFFSMTWVILGHSLNFEAKNAIPYFFMKKVKQWTFYGIYSATVSVDTFFTLSGLLVAYLTLREMSKRGGAKKINWFMFYFHRYWRLTPAYMLTLMVFATISQHLGDGPRWPQNYQPGEACAKNWWTNLLYVNNYVDISHGCFGWSWYLANDMQFYILSPLIIVPLFYNVFVGGISAGIFLIGTTIARAYISKEHEYTALFGGFYGPRPKDQNYMKNIYFPAHTRMGPYIIGLLAGYLLYRYKDNFKMKRVWNLLGWFLCMSTIILIIYGVYPDDEKHFLSVNESVAYVTLHRTGWGIAIAWIIFACATGHGGWINDFLSWSPFAPLGRLSYCAYLVHLVWMGIYDSSQRTNVYLTDLEMIYYYIGNVVMSYFAAFGTSLLFEAPMMGLEKVFFKRG